MNAHPAKQGAMQSTITERIFAAILTVTPATNGALQALAIATQAATASLI